MLDYQLKITKKETNFLPLLPVGIPIKSVDFPNSVHCWATLSLLVP